MSIITVASVCSTIFAFVAMILCTMISIHLVMIIKGLQNQSNFNKKKVMLWTTSLCVGIYNITIILIFVCYLLAMITNKVSNEIRYTFDMCLLLGKAVMMLVFVQRIDFIFKDSSIAYSTNIIRGLYSIIICLFIIIIFFYLFLMIASFAKLKIFEYVAAAIWMLLDGSLSIILLIMFLKKLGHLNTSGHVVAHLVNIMTKCTVLVTVSISTTYLNICLTIALSTIIKDSVNDKQFVTNLLFIADCLINSFSIYLAITDTNSIYVKCCGCFDKCFRKCCHKIYITNTTSDNNDNDNAESKQQTTTTDLYPNHVKQSMNVNPSNMAENNNDNMEISELYSIQHRKEEMETNIGSSVHVDIMESEQKTTTSDLYPNGV